VATSAPNSERFESLLHDIRREGRVLLVHGSRSIRGTELEEMRRLWGCRLREVGTGPGEPMGMEAPFTPDAVALFLAILAKGCIVALVPPGDPANDAALRSAGAVHGWRQSDTEGWTLEERLPPFGTDRVALPAAPGLLLAGRRSGTFEFALGIEELLRGLDPQASLATLAPLHTREGMVTLLTSLARGESLSLPSISRAPSAHATPAGVRD
jgi:hypothetical protein